MLIPFSNRTTRVVHLWLQCMAVTLVVIGALLVSNGSTVATAQDSGSIPFPERSSDPNVRVFDTAGVLTDGEERALTSDTTRADTLGYELLVYTRLSNDSREESQVYADRLRTEWHVESSEGADNGIVFMLAINPSGVDASSVIVSYGENTFPIRQLTATRFDAIVADEMTPALASGQFATALNYGTRRMLNYAEYTPPNPPALNTRQERVGNFTTVLAAVLLQVAVIGLVMLPVVTRGRLGSAVNRRWLTIYALAIGAMSALIGVAAIYARDGFASLSCLALVIWCGAVVPLLAQWLAPTEGDGHTDASRLTNTVGGSHV